MKTIRTYKQTICLLFLNLFLFSCTSNGYSYPNVPIQFEDEQQSNEIKIALLLDTSSSMSGLIDQAKSQLWKIVNALSMAKKGQENAKLKIALYQYGNDLLNGSEGYIEQILPLTNDLDAI